MRRLLELIVLAAISLAAPASKALDWPQWLGPQRDGIWRETGILERFPASGLRQVWSAPVGAGYSGPAVANGKVYLMDRILPESTRNPDDPFARGLIPGTERVLCFDEATGELIWKHEYDCPYTVSYPAGPRVTPVAAGGSVYALGAEGHLHCLDAQTGEVKWAREFQQEFGVKTPLWGFSAHPLLDGDRLICLAGGKGSTAVAFDKDTGEEVWRALEADEPGYCPPVIIEAAGKRQLIIWHPEAVNSLNPETGEVYWSIPWEVRTALTVPTPRQMDDVLFFTTFYNGSLALRLNPNRPAADPIWRSRKISEKDTDGLHSIISTPFLTEEHIYGVGSYGQLRCLRLSDGERLWETFEPTTDGEPVRWSTAFLVRHEDRFFLFNEHGELILARLEPEGYEELSRAQILEPTNQAAGRAVVWSHPAFANRRVYARNDRELVCVSLEAEAPRSAAAGHP